MKILIQESLQECISFGVKKFDFKYQIVDKEIQNQTSIVNTYLSETDYKIDIKSY